MKIVNKVTGETVYTITTNHSMSLDDAIRLAGEIINADPGEPDVLIDGREYYSEDLEMVWED